MPLDERERRSQQRHQLVVVDGGDREFVCKRHLESISVRCVYEIAMIPSPSLPLRPPYTPRRRANLPTSFERAARCRFA
jgi:hypothetical protein